MYLLLTDETNTKPSSDAKFFIYGGICFPIDHLINLNIEIAKIREDSGYRPGDEFKFNTVSRPERVSVEKFAEAKNKVIDLCRQNGVKFIVYVILHDIIKRRDPNESVIWAADYVIGRFNYFLQKNNENGICIVDNLPVKKQFKYLSEKFQFGLDLPDEDRKVLLDKIHFFGATCINASHINSAMDIVLGAFRYCINNPKNPDAASVMMKKVVSMMWHRKIDGVPNYEGYGFICKPSRDRISCRRYKIEYDQLVAHIKSLLNA